MGSTTLGAVGAEENPKLGAGGAEENPKLGTGGAAKLGAGRAEEIPKLGAGEAEENLKLKLSLFFSIFGQLMSSLVECQSWNELCDMYL